jgi:GTP-binding protein
LVTRRTWAAVHRARHARLQRQIIGENSRDNDLDVIPLRTKQLTNIRTHSKDEAVRLTPCDALTLEQSIAYIQDEELSKSRAIDPLRKRALLPHLRPKEEGRSREGLTSRAYRAY